MWGSISPDVFSVSFLMYSTRRTEQDCSTQLLSLHKTSPGNIASGDSILCSNSKTSTYVPARRCKPARTRKKKGVRGCVCLRRRQKFQLFQSQVISLYKKKKKKPQLLFSFSCLFSLERVIFSLPVFLLHRLTFFFFLALQEEEEKKVCWRKWINTTWKSI